TAFLMHLLLLIVCSISQGQSPDQHATTTVRLNKSLFQLASKKAKSIIDKLVLKVDIPAIDVTESGVHFYTTSINLTHFDFPRTIFSISEDGLIWYTDGGKIELRVHFVCRFELLPGGPRITKVGFVTVTVEDLRTYLNAIIKVDNSRPVISSNNCSTIVDKLDVVFKAGIAGWVLNIIKGFIIDDITKSLSASGCKLTSELIRKGNEFVQKQPEEVRIWRNIYINYTAAKNPVYHEDYVEAECSFRVAIHDNGTHEWDEVDDFLGDFNKHISINSISVSTPSVTPLALSLRDFAVFALTVYGAFCLLKSIVAMVMGQRVNTVAYPRREGYDTDDD
ncbi:hypothetical protein PMAYCL1PPCAC_09290, partial [Pristionchus mayeri]